MDPSHEGGLPQEEVWGDLSSSMEKVNVNGKLLSVLYLPHRLVGTVPLVMFVHGLGTSMQIWRYQLAYFKKTANVLAVDLPGHGGSDCPSEYVRTRLFT